jgi:hypothetical protein
MGDRGRDQCYWLFHKGDWLRVFEVPVPFVKHKVRRGSPDPAGPLTAGLRIRAQDLPETR